MSEYSAMEKDLIGFGIFVGALIGVFVSFFVDVDLSYIFSFSAGGGVLTASLISLSVEKMGGSQGLSFIRLYFVGVGFGVLVGGLIGLVVAWMVVGDYVLGGFVGGVAGFLGGLVLVTLLSFFE